MGTNRRIKQVTVALESLQRAATGLESLDAARQIRECAEALEREQVDAARKGGYSWAQIGALYGMSKQGAQQRFRPGKGAGSTARGDTTSTAVEPTAG